MSLCGGNTKLNTTIDRSIRAPWLQPTVGFVTRVAVPAVATQATGGCIVLPWASSGSSGRFSRGNLVLLVKRVLDQGFRAHNVTVWRHLALDNCVLFSQVTSKALNFRVKRFPRSKETPVRLQTTLCLFLSGVGGYPRRITDLETKRAYINTHPPA